RHDNPSCSAWTPWLGHIVSERTRGAPKRSVHDGAQGLRSAPHGVSERRGGAGGAVLHWPVVHERGEHGRGGLSIPGGLHEVSQGCRRVTRVVPTRIVSLGRQQKARGAAGAQSRSDRVSEFGRRALGERVLEGSR